MQQPVGARQAAINIKLLFQYALRIDPTKRHHPVPLGVRVSFPARRSVGAGRAWSALWRRSCRMFPGTRGVSPGRSVRSNRRTFGRPGPATAEAASAPPRSFQSCYRQQAQRLRSRAVTSGRCLRRRSRARPRHVIQKKTERPVQFEITEQTRASIRGWPRLAPRRRSGLN
jgi:hypothetical protein